MSHTYRAKCLYCGDYLNTPWVTVGPDEFCSDNCARKHIAEQKMQTETKTLDSVIDLVRRMHQEGVTKFKMNLHSGAIEVEFAPEFVQRPAPGVDTSIDVEAPAAHDPSMCVRCQKSPPNGMHAGHCRKCSLELAGVS